VQNFRERGAKSLEEGREEERKKKKRRKIPASYPILRIHSTNVEQGRVRSRVDGVSLLSTGQLPARVSSSRSGPGSVRRT
jgi:hypothetical protein